MGVVLCTMLSRKKAIIPCNTHIKVSLQQESDGSVEVVSCQGCSAADVDVTGFFATKSETLEQLRTHVPSSDSAHSTHNTVDGESEGTSNHFLGLVGVLR